jgi:hypothetical protein
MWIGSVLAARVDGLRDRVQSFGEAPVEVHASLRAVGDEVLLWDRPAQSGQEIVKLTHAAAVDWVRDAFGAASGWSGRRAELKRASK